MFNYPLKRSAVCKGVLSDIWEILHPMWHHLPTAKLPFLRNFSHYLTDPPPSKYIFDTRRMFNWPLQFAKVYQVTFEKFYIQRCVWSLIEEEDVKGVEGTHRWWNNQPPHPSFPSKLLIHTFGIPIYSIQPPFPSLFWEQGMSLIDTDCLLDWF